MGLLSIVLLVLFALAALLMILVIMLQDDQGEGIGGLFGGGSSSAFGSRSGNILTRFTSILGAIFIIGAFALAWLNRTPESSDIVEKARLEQVKGTEDTNWWVERIQEPAPALEQSGTTPETAPDTTTTTDSTTDTAPQGETQSDLPSGMNR
jgi:preprotein translocase subunit SecG